MVRRNRHLAAIMFTDMVGYTALMQRDEGEAGAVRERHRAIIESEVEGHGGDLVQYFGDGTLSVFPSAIEAVAGAVSIQRRCQTHPKIPLRVGIHLGDVAYDEQGVYGDAVNVAARVEALGIAGGVVVSGKVVEELKSQQRFSTVPVGVARLKNVTDPVSLHCVAAEGIVIPRGDEIQRAADQQARARGEPVEETRRVRRRAIQSALAVVVAAGIGALAFVLTTARPGFPGPETTTRLASPRGARELPSVAVVPSTLR